MYMYLYACCVGKKKRFRFERASKTGQEGHTLDKHGDATVQQNQVLGEAQVLLSRNSKQEKNE